MRRLLLAALLALAVPVAAHARPPMETNQLVDGDGVPLGTASNPLNVTGGAPGGGTGGGDASAANQQKEIDALGAPGDAAYSGSGNGTLVGLSKSQRAILANLLIANGNPADAVALAGDASQIGLLKALRALLGGTLNIQGVPNGEPQRIVAAQPDNVLSPYSITATGVTAGVPLTGYGSVALELGGAFAANVVLQVSYDSTDGVNGTWTTAFGAAPEDPGANQCSSALNASLKRRVYSAAGGAWARVSTTYTSGTVTATLARRTASVAERCVYVGNTISALSAATFSEAFRTTLAASTTTTGTTRDLGGTTGAYARFGATAVSDQSGTLQLQTSTDGTNFITVASQAVTAGTALDLSVPVRARYYRAVFVNGATAATVFSLLTSYTAA